MRRLGALGVWVEEDAERLGERLRLSNAESERLAGAGRLVARGAGAGRDRPRGAALSPRRAIISSTACWWPGARSEAGAADDCLARIRDSAAALGGAGFSAQSRGFHESRRCARARRSATPYARPRRPGSRPIFRLTAPRSTSSPKRRQRAYRNRDGGTPRHCGRAAGTFAEAIRTCRRHQLGGVRQWGRPNAKGMRNHGALLGMLWRIATGLGSKIFIPALKHRTYGARRMLRPRRRRTLATTARRSENVAGAVFHRGISLQRTIQETQSAKAREARRSRI